MMMTRILLLGLTSCLCVTACSKTEAPPPEPRPVRSIVVAGGAPGEAVT
jgi:hypothetical protein